MRNRLRAAWVALSAIPFLLEQPYSFRTMSTTPTERWNWCFLCGALAMAALMAPKWLSTKSRPPASAAQKWLPLLLPLALLAFGYARHIHMAILAGGLLLPSCLIHALWGWRHLLLCIPPLGMLALACPSVGYLLSIALSHGEVTLKAILAAVLAVLVPILYLVHLEKVTPKALAFSILALLVPALYLSGGRSIALQPPALPDFSRLIANDFRGVQETDDAGDRAFFGDSLSERFQFLDATGTTIGALHVWKIADVHKIHPTAFCLRVGAYRLLQEQTLHLPAKEGLPAMDVLEILAERQGRKRLFWQWYSTPTRSTGSFLLFRTLYSPKDDWSAFIVDTPVADSLEERRETLHRFVGEFMGKSELGM